MNEQDQRLEAVGCRREAADREELDVLWGKLRRARRADRRLAARNALAEKLLYLVHRQARQLAAKLPDHVDTEDLVQEGFQGMLDAMRKFDPAAGTQFATYSAMRIRGAMLDWIRSQDWAPRTVRRQATELAAAEDRLALDRRPTESELAGELGVDLVTLDRWRRAAEVTAVMSLEHTVYDSDGRDLKAVEVLADPRGEDPTKPIGQRELWRKVCRGLGKRDRLILLLYYAEQMTMKEIAATLGTSESRVSQVHSQLLAMLKAKFGSREGLESRGQ